jgi:hypothetical protein
MQKTRRHAVQLTYNLAGSRLTETNPTLYFVFASMSLIIERTHSAMSLQVPTRHDPILEVHGLSKPLYWLIEA